MKKLIVLFLFPLMLTAQFSEYFNGFSNWQGDTSKFVVDSLSRLQLMAPPQADQAQIWHSSMALLEGQWQLDIRMEFNPSSSNYTIVHLSLDSTQNGYYVKLGGTNDEISFYKSTQGTSEKLITGPMDFIDVPLVEIHLLVHRDSIGNWNVYAKHFGDSTFSLQGSCFDDTHLSSQYFGIECVYTSTRSDKFFFDNIEVEGYSFVDPFLYPQHQDIVINEVLFNPLEGDNDFVEIINRSSKTLCIKGLQLGNYYAQQAANLKPISEGYNFMLPNELLVLCISKQTLLDYHPQALEEQIIELESMPTYNNDQGVVVLALDSISIDEFHYDENMHFDLLQDVEGVSLERINADITTNDNWHSASEPSGFSTPTLPNSQVHQKVPAKDIMTLSPPVFTPNNDGQDDILSIQLTFEQSGYRGRLLIFNVQGFLIKTLINNTLFGTVNTYYWDGLTDRNEPATTARYIVWLEAIHPNQSPILQKQSVVVGWY